jgi:hypothetical protein
VCGKLANLAKDTYGSAAENQLTTVPRLPAGTMLAEQRGIDFFAWGKSCQLFSSFLLDPQHPFSLSHAARTTVTDSLSRFTFRSRAAEGYAWAGAKESCFLLQWEGGAGCRANGDCCDQKKKSGSVHFGERVR